MLKPSTGLKLPLHKEIHNCASQFLFCSPPPPSSKESTIAQLKSPSLLAENNTKKKKIKNCLGKENCTQCFPIIQVKEAHMPK